MNPPAASHLAAIRRQLQPALPGLFFAVLTLIFGFGLGIFFGLNEDLIKDQLKTSADEVIESVYNGDAVAAKAVTSKSWVYMKRVHLHAGGLGATAMGMTLIVCLLGTSPCKTRVISLFLGVGGLGYSIFWLWAGFRAPALGSTGAAKESLKWLAMPSSGAVVLATLAVAALILSAMLRKPQYDS